MAHFLVLNCFRKFKLKNNFSSIRHAVGIPLVKMVSGLIMVFLSSGFYVLIGASINLIVREPGNILQVLCMHFRRTTKCSDVISN